jgi:soluble lytic murein transglycosylase-like protein
MLKNKWKLRKGGKILSMLLLMNCLKFPMYGEPQTEPPPSLTENETKRYSDFEIDILIDDISEAAHEAIEQAAAEAARAAALASLEREAAALREAQRWQLQAETAQKKGMKSAVITGVITFLSGFAIGTGIFFFTGR